ncbi:MAG: hypothetical protein QOK46_125, partial [Microbacteriaceae bacterium]|nr:hypothetical protein [Microbacteriaceae bacterium]
EITDQAVLGDQRIFAHLDDLPLG